MESKDTHESSLHGRMDAVAGAYRRSRARLVWMARSTGLDLFQAEDVVQDVFFRLVRSAHRLDCERPLEAYLERVVVHAARHARIPERGRVVLIDHDGLDALQGPVKGDYWLGEVAIREVFSGVAVHDARMLLARYRDGISHDELALMYGISRRTCLRRLARARANLARVLRLGSGGARLDIPGKPR